MPGSARESPKDHQGAISDVITLGSLYYKLEFGLSANPDTAGQEGRAALNPQQDKVL